MDMKKIINILLTAVLATGIWVNTGAQSIDPGTIEKIRQARYVASSPKVASLGLLHYSDIHGDDFAVARLREAISELDPYIDAVEMSSITMRTRRQPIRTIHGGGGPPDWPGKVFSCWAITTVR